MGTKLPRKLEQKMKLVGEQIRLARLRRDLSVAQVADDTLGRALQDMNLPQRERASKKE